MKNPGMSVGKINKDKKSEDVLEPEIQDEIEMSTALHDNKNLQTFLNDIADNSYPNPDKMFEGKDFDIDVERALNTLDPRPKEVIKLYYGIDQERSLTLEEIGEKVGVTRERVRQIKEEALRWLRKKQRRELLRKYLS